MGLASTCQDSALTPDNNHSDKLRSQALTMAKSLLPGCTHTHTCLAANAARRPPVRLCLQARRDPSESSTFTFERSCCVQLCRGEGCRRTALCHNTLASRTTSRRLCAEPHVSAATPPAKFALLVSPCPSITHTHPAQPTLHFALLLSQPRVTPPSVHSLTHSAQAAADFALLHPVPRSPAGEFALSHHQPTSAQANAQPA